MYGLAVKKIITSPPAVDSKYFYRRSPAAIKKWRLKYHLGSKPYFLVLGNIEPKKNLLRILKAYRLLPAKLRDGYQLLFIGENGWNNQEILAAISKAQADGLAVKLLFAKVRRADIPIALSGAEIGRAHV